jgi:hypothetical protein
MGRARQLCPGISDLDFLGDLNSHRRSPCRDIDPCLPVRRYINVALVRRRECVPNLSWVETNAGALADEAGILTRREAAAGAAATREQKIALTGLLGEFDPDRTTSLALADRCSIGLQRAPRLICSSARRIIMLVNGILCELSSRSRFGVV